MALSDSESMFIIDETTADELGVSLKSMVTKGAMAPNIMNIFYKAKKIGKTELSLDEITVAYYNMYTKPEKDRGIEVKIKTKNDIAVKLFAMRGNKKHPGVIELVPGTRGLYRIKENNQIVTE